MLTIGQIARIFGISTKTLRHYDAIGLYSPTHIGSENQYRYYAPEQLAILRNILMLRQLGLGLEVINGLVQSNAFDDPALISRILQEHAERIRMEIEQKQNILRAVEMMNNQIEKWGTMMLEPKVVDLPEMTIVGMEYRSTNTEDSIPAMWQRFIPREHEVQHKVNPDASYGICDGKTDGLLIYVAGYEVSHAVDIPDGMRAITIPSQKYAVFTHTGPTTQIAATFQNIYAKWLKEYNLEPVEGYDFERYDQRFLGPMHEQSQLDLYIPVR
ncbi:UNVERIFIED_CONTAM: putative transcriptional regulator YdeE/DNA-binding transcriptional MerR regulator [Brevibacillus sp. OAP136]